MIELIEQNLPCCGRGLSFSADDHFCETASFAHSQNFSTGGLSRLFGPARGPHYCSICFLIAGIAGRNTSRNSDTTGFSEDLRHVTHRGIRADFGAMARIAAGRFKLRTQRGTREMPSLLSTSVNNVAMKSASFTMRGENPARRQTVITSSNRVRAPLRWNCTNGSPASAFNRTTFCFASGCDRGRAMGVRPCRCFLPRILRDDRAAVFS